VSGIGTNGNDGVRIMTGGGGGATMSLGVFNPDVLPIDAFLHWAAIDPRDQTLLNLSVQPAPGSGGAIFAAYNGLGAPTASVALYSNDVLVAYANGISASVPLVRWTGGPLPMILHPCIVAPEDCYGVIHIAIPDPAGPVITLPGSAAVRG